MRDMSVTKMKRIGHLYAGCLGMLGATLVWLVCPVPMDREAAVAEAQPYLDDDADVASLSIDGRTWTVTAGDERAVLDAQTGELLEIEF